MSDARTSTRLVAKTFEELINDFSSGNPTPGGGSASAASGALAASLGLMICELTIDRKDYADVQEEVEEIRGRLGERKKNLLNLVDEDASSYQEVFKAYRLPQDTEDEKEARSKAIGAANWKATMAPAKTITEALLVLEDLERLMHIGNRNTRSDAGTAIAIINAVVLGAYLNVRVNLPGVPDEAFREKALKLINESLVRSGERMKECFGWLNSNL